MSERRTLRRFAAWLLLGWLPAGSVHAIDITVVYEEDERPAFDPDGTQAMLIFEAAAAIWEDILEGPGSYTLGICYQDLGTGLGIWSPDPFGNNDISVNSNPSSPWFFDPTPLDDNEFDFTLGGVNSGQTLYSGLTPAQQSTWFAGSPPSLLEVGYRGTAPISSAANGNFDMLSTAIHEIGHDLGINGLELDFEFEFKPEHVGGANFTVESDSSGHLLPTMVLMAQGSGAVSLRRKPTQTDILAMAYDQDISDVDLPRNDFLGVAGNDLNAKGNWFGESVPDGTDDVFIRVTPALTAVASANIAMDNLTIDFGNQLHVGSQVLQINTKLHLQGGAQLAADSGGFVNTDLMQIDVGSVDLAGGLLLVGTLLLLTGPNSAIRGWGEVNLGGTGLRNDGVLAADFGTLVIDGSAATDFDLDGVNSGGVLLAEDGDLTIRGVPEVFQGPLSARDHTIRFEDGAILGDQSHVTLDDAVLAGGTFASGRQVEIHGPVEVTDAVVTADVRLGPTSSVIIDEPGFLNIGVLQLVGRTHYDGVTIFGDILEQTGVATVTADSTIDVGILDLDGAAESSAVTTVEPGVFFNLSANDIETFNGLLSIDGGVVVVNSLDLTMAGTLRMSAGGQLQGAGLDLPGTLTTSGTGGTSSVFSAMRAQNGASIIVSGASDVLELVGAVSIDGTTGFFGSGTLRQVGDLTINTSTTLGGFLSYDWDGNESTPSTTTIASGTTLTLQPTTILAGSVGSDGRDGIINVNGGTLLVNLPSAASWRLEGTLNLTQSGSGATVGGTSPLNVRGTVRATGLGIVDVPVQFLSGSSTVVTGAADTLRLARTIDYAGGTFTGAGMIEQRGNATVTATTTINAGIYDWDGLGGPSSPTTTVNSGTTFRLNVGRIENTATPSLDGVSGVVNVNSGNLEVNTTQPWRLDGSLNLTQSVAAIPTLSGASLLHYGTIRATGTGRINSAIDLQTNSSLLATNVGDTLILGGATTYREDASLSGAGTIVQAGAATVAAPTTINVAVFDWDGEEATPSNMLADLTSTFFDNALVINATQIERGNPALDGYDGTLTLRGMELFVNTLQPWRLDGTMLLIEDGVHIPRVFGAPMLVHGTLDVQGDAVIEADVELHPGAAVLLSPGDTLRIEDELFYRGGNVAGLGQLTHNFDATVEADTTIDVQTLDLDGDNEDSGLKINSGRLTINAVSLDVADNVVNTEIVLAGFLDVVTPSAWTVGSQLRMAGGSLLGSAVTVNGPITGHGVIKPTAVTVNGGLFADQSLLRISSDSFPDLDGSGTGRVEALVGDIEITSAAGGLVPFGGTLAIGTGHSYTQADGGLAIGGTLELSGGTYSAPLLEMTAESEMLVSAVSVLDTAVTLSPTSLTTLLADLHVQGSATALAGAFVTGTRSLLVDAGATLQGDAALAVSVRSSGTVRPGVSGIGSLSLIDYVQDAAAQLAIEIGPSGYDELNASGTARLDGTLDIDVAAGFFPTFGDVFKIVRFSGGRVGVFSSILDLSLGPNLSLAPVYETESLKLFVSVPGDANLDGMVTGADFTIWADNFDAIDVGWSEGDFNGDGRVSGADFTIWADHFNQSAMPVPEPGTLALLAAAVIVGAHYVRRLSQMPTLSAWACHPNFGRILPFSPCGRRWPRA